MKNVEINHKVTLRTNVLCVLKDLNINVNVYNRFVKVSNVTIDKITISTRIRVFVIKIVTKIYAMKVNIFYEYDHIDHNYAYNSYDRFHTLTAR